VPESQVDLVRRLEQIRPVEAGLDPEDGPAAIAFSGPPTDKGPLGRLDGLHMRRELGRGRFAVVYEAVDELDRVVAVKVLRPQLAADARERARFEQEARKAAAVRHDHIVTVHRVGQAPGSALLYLVMECLAGETLAQRLRRQGVLPPREAAAVVRQVALGLAAAHAGGLVHRDVKPSNILLEDGGVASGGVVSGSADDHSPLTTHQSPLRAKVADFGLARATEAGSAASQSGALVGTPAYMSPEQVTTPGRLDGRSDVYSLGVVLYEALTGERPFRGLPHLVLQQVVHDEARPPRKLNDAVPGDLETITLKCLAKEPGRRYPTAGELADDLQRWLEGRPIQARPVSPWERGVKWVKRRPAASGLLGVSGLSVLALVALAVGLFYNTRLRDANTRLEDALIEASEQRGEAEKQRTRAEEQEGVARHYLYYSRIYMADRAWREAQIARMQELLDEQRPERTGKEDLRGFEWYYLWRLCHSSLLTFRGHTRAVISVAFSPDGKRLASASADGTVKVWDATSDQAALTLRGHPGQLLCVAFSPDGKHLASAGTDKTVKVWDAASGQVALTLKGHTGGVVSVAFSPDGKRLASGGVDRTVKVWDATSGQEALILQGHTGTVDSVAFSPDGKRLASASGDRTVKVWDATSGQEALTLQGHTDPVYSVAFSPDGKRLASASWDKTVKVWDATSGQEALTLQGHTDLVCSVAFSPDGKRLASASWDRTVKVCHQRPGGPHPPGAHRYGP
jgi:Tol biopolymer transport system component